MGHRVRRKCGRSTRTNGGFVHLFKQLFQYFSRVFSGRSSITRASSFIAIPDLSEKEAMAYLTERRSLSPDVAKEVYAVFGGRLKSLQNAATKIESGIEFASMLKFLLQESFQFSLRRNSCSESQ